MSINGINKENLKTISNLADRPQISAQELKEAFDNNSNLIADFINVILIPEINKIASDIPKTEAALLLKADKTEIPIKISDLEDDTNPENRISCAMYADTANVADIAAVATRATMDENGNIFHEVYVAKTELPVKISDLEDDSERHGFNVNFAHWAGTADVADMAGIATRDSLGNIINETYATKSQLSDLEASIELALDEIIAIQNSLIGGDS